MKESKITEAEGLAIVNSIVGTMVDAFPCYGPLLSRCKFIPDLSPSTTAGICWKRDRWNVVLGVPFIQNLERRRQLGLLEHEFLHAMLRHLCGPRRLSIERVVALQFPEYIQYLHRLANIAEDLEINVNLIRRDRLPEGGAFCTDYGYPKHLLAEEYLRLMADSKDDFEDKYGNSTTGDGDNPMEPDGKRNGDQSGHTWGKILDQLDSGRNQDIMNNQDPWDELDEVILQKVLDECNAKSKGELPDSLQRLVDRITKPQVKWPKKFRNSMLSQIRTNNSLPTWSRPNRRGLPVPGKIYKNKPNAYVFQDTSGSITSEDLSILSSEIHGMRRHFNKIDVLVIDAKVQCRYRFRNRIESVKGGGGSDFGPAFDEIKNDRQIKSPVIILLTDGDIDVPKILPKGYEVWWILCNGNCAVPYGHKIILER